MLSILATLFYRRKKIVAEGAAGGLVATLESVKAAAPPEKRRQIVKTLLSLLPADSKFGKFVKGIYRKLVPIPTTPGALPSHAEEKPSE